MGDPGETFAASIHMGPLGDTLCWTQEAEGNSPRVPDNMFKSLEPGEDVQGLRDIAVNKDQRSGGLR